MTDPWDLAGAGVTPLPSGRRVRGRGLGTGSGAGSDSPPPPTFTLFLLRRRPPPTPWRTRWVRWPDFWLPTDRGDAVDALNETWLRAASERVEVVCTGGRGRTGTALACLAVLDGATADEAVRWVRERYDRRAIETPWQRGFVRTFARAVG